MFVLNGSKDFVKLIGSGIESAPEYPIHDTSSHTMQWVFHAFKERRKHCVIAMHAFSRYCILFVGVQKQSAAQFFQLFVERLFNEMIFLCDIESHQAKPMVDFVVTQHRRFIMCQRNDRSVQSHINEVIMDFRYELDEIGQLPQDNDEMYGFGCYTNSALRKTARDNDYFRPAERMRDYWLRTFVQISPAAKDKPRHLRLVEKKNPNNIHFLADYKNPKK